MSSSRSLVRGAMLAAAAVCPVLLAAPAAHAVTAGPPTPPATSAPDPTTGPDGPALVTVTPTPAPSPTPTPVALPTTTSFTTAGCSTWTVPAGMRSIDAIAVGSQGGKQNTIGQPGSGARATATLAVVAGQSLRICVNSGGGSSLRGGGASGIAAGTDFSTPLLVAGGGGAASYWTGPGGNGSARGGNAGTPNGVGGSGASGAGGGGGGTQTAGGGGATVGRPTTASGPGSGGSGFSASGGIQGDIETFTFSIGGDGGSGYYGGGGGGASSSPGAGGGGGSSYCASTRNDVSACAFSLEPNSAYGAGAGAGLAKVLLSYVAEDTTPPVVTPLVAGNQGDNGWYTATAYTSDVSVVWAVSDPDSSITTQTGCDETIITTDTAGTDVTCTATSLGGTTTETVTIKRDTQAPTLGVNDAPVDGETYTIDYLPGPPRCTAVDATSGVIANGCDLFGFSREPGTHTMTISARDNAGNFAMQSRTYTLIDRTPPEITKTVTGTLGSNGWYTSNVGVKWTVYDPDFDVDSTTGCGPTVVSDDTTGLDITCTATSPGGESTETVTIKRDTAAPLLSVVGGPSDGGSYTLGSVPAAPECSADDETSGVDGGCTVDGYSAALGEHTITFSAKDYAGHEVTETVAYSVSGSTATISGSAPNTTAGASYAFAFTVGGDPAATVSLESGSLPPGITLSDDGELSGSSTVAGTYRFAVKAENSVGSASSAPQSITVAPAAAAELIATSGDAQSAAPGQAFAKPLLVLVTDIYGNPVGNQKVTFTVSSAAANLAGANARTLTTKADGYVGASLTGKSTGTVRVTAALTGNTTVPTVLFTESVRSTSTSKADLAVSITGVPASLPVGATATVTVKVKNNGPSSASSILTTLDPGPGVTVISATGGTIAPLGTAGQWTASSLASGSTLSYTARIKVTSMPWCASARIRVATASTTNDTTLTNNAIGPLLRITDASAPS